MKLAIEYLEPMLERSNTEAMATIVVATVEGDIHDNRKKSCGSDVEELRLSCDRPWQGCSGRCDRGYQQ